MFAKDQIIGRNYKVIARLGEGGMGQVYRALDVNLGREVAVKFLLPEIAKDEEIVKRFLNEGRVLATINHPAVISVYASDVEETNGVPFLVMEFVDGHNLDHYQENFRQNPVELLHHFIQLMSGIHACHQKGIIHRDLKPENLLINSRNQLKIVDFGIAKSASKQTKTGIALGTPHYMSPEQCLGKQDITAKTDVYAAGIMLFEILTGTLPFKIDGHVDDPALTIALMHLNQQADFNAFEQCPKGKEFRALVEKMMAKKPDERPEVPVILSELRAILDLFDDSEKPTMAKEAVKPRNDNMIGEIYEIQAELGSGGMGKVFRALDTALNRTVAIKVLHESTSKDTSLVDRFIQEGQVLATVGHRNVMGIYASSRDKRTGRPFLVMEYIEGKSLKKVKDALGDDRSKAVPIMVQLVEGLSACHEKGIIHRDLKPANIIITNSGLVKILDFGIAKTAANLTKTGMTVGTPEYMSPEQCTGSKNLSVKSDIYSLGIIFWELIFGHVPFKADADTNPELSIALKHIEATLPAQAAIPDMSLVKIIGLTRRMLDKDPNARPDTDQILDTLLEYLEEHLPEALPARTSSSRRSSRHSASAISGLVQAAEQNERKQKKSFIIPIILIIILGGGLYAWKSGLFKPQPKIEYEKEINGKIQSADFNGARKLLQEFETTETGKSRASFIRVDLSKAMIKKAEEYANNLEYQKAINLYAQAIVLDPANPQAALNLSKLQADFQKVEQLKKRVEELKSTSMGLLAGLEPASGTNELNDCLKELNEAGMATFALDISARWKTRFIASGSPLIQDQPEKALQYFEELQKFFPEFKEVEELTTRARTRSQELKSELENADRLNSLKNALEAAIDNYTTGQNQELILKQIDKVAELGEQEQAQDLKKKFAGKVSLEAEKQIVNNPQRAMQLLRNAQNIFPDLEGLATKMQLASESLITLQSSEAMKTERDNLANEIAADIEAIAPPADIAPIISKLEKLEKYQRGERRASRLKDSLFEKYFASVALEIERSPETAKVILAYCTQLRPDAPGLKEISANIEEKLALEAARKKAAEDKLRAQRLENAKNAIYTGIKKDPIPADLEKIFTEISALQKDYPESDAPEKLFEHLKNRCRDEIADYIKSGSDKAETTIALCRKLFADDADFIRHLDKSENTLKEKQQLEEKKKLVSAQLQEIDAFIRKPQSEKLTALQANFDEIARIISKEEANKARKKVIQALEKRFEASENPDSAKERFSLLEGVDTSLKGKFTAELDKLAIKKVTGALKFITEFKPATDMAEISNKMQDFATWDRQLEKTQALEKLKANYIDEATRLVDTEPEQAFELLMALQKIPDLARDSQIRSQADNIKKIIGAGKNNQQVQAMLSSANSIIDGGKIQDRKDQLFQIIDFLKANSPADAEKTSKRAAVSLEKLAESALAGENFDGAEKTVLLIRQFDPTNEKAQQIQVKIAEAKKAKDKPKELVVGPTGNFRTISEAVAAAPEGMTIKIQPGNYNEKLVLQKSVNLVGEAAGRCSVSFTNQPTVIVNGSCSIRNLTITNNSSVPQPTVHFLKGNAELSGCILSNSSPAKPPDYHGVIMVSAGAPVIRDNRIISSKAMGITVSGGSPIIQKNTITGCGLYGMWFNGLSKAQVSENGVSGNSKSGIGIKNGASPNLTTNVIENNGENGLLIYANGAGRYEGNRLSNNTLSGIEVWDAQPESIRNNVFSGNRRDGIHVRGNNAVARIGKNQLNAGQAIHKAGGRIIDL